MLAALAGLVFALRLNTATPKAGLGFELDVIAACFIGGAYGGVGRVGGAEVGALIMGGMNNGMSIPGIGIDYQQVVKGLVLLSAVCLDVYNQRRSREKPRAGRTSAIAAAYSVSEPLSLSNMTASTMKRGAIDRRRSEKIVG